MNQLNVVDLMFSMNAAGTLVYGPTTIGDNFMLGTFSSMYRWNFLEVMYDNELTTSLN
jgi:hypothetical protein